MQMFLQEAAQKLSQNLKCRVCKQLKTDLLTLAKCGHSMCKACTDECDGKCPFCKVKFEPIDLQQTEILHGLAQQSKQLSELLGLQIKPSKSHVKKLMDQLDKESENKGPENPEPVATRSSPRKPKPTKGEKVRAIVRIQHFLRHL